MAGDERSGSFLPPEPAGPEPELEGGPGSSPPGAGAGPQAPPGAGPQAPPGAGPQAPPPGQAYPPPSGQPYPAQPGQPYPPQPQWGGQPWGYQAPAPDNTPAVVGFVLSVVSASLLLVSGGLSSVISVGCAIAGIVYGRKGRMRVDAGETPKHRSLAQAGFVIGIVSLVLSLIATAFWILLLVLALTDEDVQNDLEREFDNSESIRAAVRIGLAAGRVSLHLFA